MKKYNYNTRDIERFFSYIDMEDDGCWLWQASLCHGTRYAQFWLKPRNISGHTFSYCIYYGGIPSGKQVNHTCKHKHCVNPLHLYAGTQTDNMRDRFKDGTANIGEKNGFAKLSNNQVAEIRAKFIPFVYTLKMLAEEYGVRPQTIWNIVHLYKGTRNVLGNRNEE